MGMNNAPPLDSKGRPLRVGARVRCVGLEGSAKGMEGRIIELSPVEDAGRQTGAPPPRIVTVLYDGHAVPSVGYAMNLVVLDLLS